jgi:DNA invertase Pin-like site-specific DNA recombinase
MKAFDLTQAQEADLVKVLTYGRVSTTKQVRKDGEAGSLEKQDEAMQTLVESHAKSKGWKVCGNIVDSAEAGDNPDRKGLNDIMAAARRRQFNVLVVFAQDRLARDWTTVKRVIRELEALGVQIYTSNGARITHKTLEGITQSMILAMMSELGLENIRFGRRKDIAMTASMGQWSGSRAGLGYLSVKVSGRRRELVRDIDGFNPYSTEAITRSAEGDSATAILESFAARGIRTPSKIMKVKGVEVETGLKPITLGHLESIISNPIHMGCLAVKDYAKAVDSSGAGLPEPITVLEDGTAIYKGNHEASVERDVWFRSYQNFHGRPKVVRKARRADTGGNFLLQGLLRCRRCDRTMTTRGTQGAPSYKCMAAHLGGKSSNCTVCSVPARPVETAVLRLFAACATHSSIVDEIFSEKGKTKTPASDRVISARKAVKETKDECDRLVVELGRQMEEPVRDVISARLRELGSRISDLNRNLEEALHEDPNVARTRASFVEVAQKIFHCHNQHAEACRPETKALLQSLLTAVYIDVTASTGRKRTLVVELRLKYSQTSVDHGVIVPLKLEFEVSGRSRQIVITKPFQETCDLSPKASPGNPALMLFEKYLELSEKMKQCEIAKQEGKKPAHVTQVLSLGKIPPQLRAKVKSAPPASAERFSQNCLRKIAHMASLAEQEAAVNHLLGLDDDPKAA